MGNDLPPRDDRDAHALRSELLHADDQKIRRILAVVDEISDPAVNQALLDPLRPRLATLKPARPLRFARLLFIPLDLLTVPALGWLPGERTIPRSVLTPIAKIVRAGLGSVALDIDKIIADARGDATQAITQAGEALWPQAAEILAVAPVPADWPDTGLPPSAYGPLAASIAAVLGRARQLRRLARDEEIGVVTPDHEAVEDVLRNIAEEAEASCAMIVRLVMEASPHALPALRHIVSTGRDQAEKAMMQQAIERGMEAALAHMEVETGFGDGIGHCALASVGSEVRRVTSLLREIETDAASARHTPRLNAIRHRLDDACRARFARGVDEGLVTRLAAATRPMNGLDQTELEACARDLRKLDTAVRRTEVQAGYDQLLLQAAAAVRVAAAAGTITAMRNYRLIEILEGSDAAEALYLKAHALP